MVYRRRAVESYSVVSSDEAYACPSYDVRINDGAAVPGKTGSPFLPFVVAVERRAICFEGNCAIVTEMSSTSVHSRTAWLNASKSKGSEFVDSNLRRLREARLHAVSSRNIYSEHGFDATIGPAAGQVCQSLIVV